jgi:hypothetical protein
VSGSAYLRFFGRGVGEPSGGQFIASPSPGDDSPLALEDQDPIPRLLLSGALLTTVLVAWDPNPVVVRLKAQDASVVEVQGDQPPRASLATRTQIVDAWKSEPWSAQSAETGLGWLASPYLAPPRRAAEIWQAWDPNTVVVRLKAQDVSVAEVQGDQPPRLGLAARAQLIDAWKSEPAAAPRAKNGIAPLAAPAADAPPPYRSPLRQVLAASEQRVVTLELRTAAADATSVDNPPPLRRGANILAWAWQPSVTVVRLGGRAGNSVVAPPAVNPPRRPRMTEMLIVAAWDATPPPALRARFVTRSGVPTPVYGFGARSRVGTATGNDPSQTIGSTTANDASQTIGTATAVDPNKPIGSSDA